MSKVLQHATTDEGELISATVWAVGQTGRHSSDHARAIAGRDTLLNMVHIINDSKWGEVIIKKVRIQLISPCTKCLQFGSANRSGI